MLKFTLSAILVLMSSQSFAVETRVTQTGAIFTRDKSNPELGKAYRSQTGVVWGDLVRKEKSNKPLLTDFQTAKEICEKKNAQLPSTWDFLNLRDQMGSPIMPGPKNEPVLPGFMDYSQWTINLTHDGVFVGVFDPLASRIFTHLPDSLHLVRCIIPTHPELAKGRILYMPKQ